WRSPREIASSPDSAHMPCIFSHAVRLPTSAHRGIEFVSLGDVNQVEQRAANTRDGRDGVSRLLKRHRAGGDFVQAVINRTGLAHIGEWHVDRDRAVAAVWSPAGGARELGE